MKKDTSSTPRYRMTPSSEFRPFNIVLVNPEIPQNTGNIARLCAATGSSLNLVGKLGFSLDAKAVRRAGLDYWHLVSVETFANLDECLDRLGCTVPILFSSKATNSYLEAPYEESRTLVFGAESVGLPEDVTRKWKSCLYGIPTFSRSVRSLNLANSVSIGLYKGLEVAGGFEHCKVKP